MPRALASRLAVLLAALCSVTVAACGGSGGGSDGSAADLISETFGAGHPIRSGHLDLSLHIDAQGLSAVTAPINLQLSGPFSSRGTGTLPDFAFALEFQARQPVTVGLISTGKAGFLTLEGTAYALGAPAYASLRQGYATSQTASAAARRRAPALSALGVAPSGWLRAPRRAGTENIGGTLTDHVTAAVDVPRLLADLDRLLARSGAAAGAAAGRSVPSSITPRTRAAIERAVRAGTVDVWSGAEDHTLRKFALDVRLVVGAADRPAVGGLRSGRLTFTATLAELNRPQTVAAPADSQPLSALAAGLRRLGLGTGTSTSTTPSTAQPQYTACLQKAGDDVAAIQRCATLVGR